MSDRANKFLWTIHTAIVEKTRKPGSEEDRRFLALALCGEIGELANLIKKEWRGDQIDNYRDKLEDEFGDVYAYLLLLAIAHNIDLEEVLQRRTIPKIQSRWPVTTEQVLTKPEPKTHELSVHTDPYSEDLVVKISP